MCILGKCCNFQNSRSRLSEGIRSWDRYRWKTKSLLFLHSSFVSSDDQVWEDKTSRICYHLLFRNFWSDFHIHESQPHQGYANSGRDSGFASSLEPHESRNVGAGCWICYHAGFQYLWSVIFRPHHRDDRNNADAELVHMLGLKHTPKFQDLLTDRESGQNCKSYENVTLLPCYRFWDSELLIAEISKAYVTDLRNSFPKWS